MAAKQKKIHIYGKHAVREALKNAPQIVKTIYLSPQMDDREIHSLIGKARIKTERIDEKRVSSQVEGNAPHQGIIALISASGLTTPFEHFLERFNPKDSLLVYLDGVQDPHNVGTIIRASAAFGAAAVFIPERAQAQVSASVIKTSAGAVFTIPIVSVPNAQQALSQLKQKGVKVCGLAGGKGSSDIKGEAFGGSSLFVLGNEAEGISGSTRALCDKLIKIEISPQVESLNVASAATAALFAWSMKHS